jgi:hypothetical protein
MTTSISNESAAPVLQPRARPATVNSTAAHAKRRHSLASRLAFLTICVMIILTTLAFGTVHDWALATFAATAAGLVCLWCLDGLTLRSVQLNRNALQWPLLGLIVLGLIQLLPLRSAPDDAGVGLSLTHALTLDRSATQLVLVQLIALSIYFAAHSDPHYNNFRFRTRNVRIDAVANQRRHPRLLVSPIDSEHRVRSLHQSSSLRRVHGIDDRPAAGLVVFRIVRDAQAATLWLCRAVDGRIAGPDEFTRGND